MRKQITGAGPERPLAPQGGWLDLDALCTVEISSEDAAYPVEAALVGSSDKGWRAKTPGKQTLRLRFDAPQRIERVTLAFTETEVERTQEIALSCSTAADGTGMRELRRQRWNFSPSGSTQENEDWRVDVDGVVILELVIVPEVSGGEARASLAALRIA
jgi:hypothetical protein